MQTYEIKIDEHQRQVLLTALTQSQLARHFGADAETREVADDLLAMIDNAISDAIEPTLNNFTL